VHGTGSQFLASYLWQRVEIVRPEPS
jgi:hypothetical protein